MELKILNLTQHVATPEQIEAGVFEPSAEDKKEIQKLLSFDELPEKKEMALRVESLTEIVIKYWESNYSMDSRTLGVMIGGAPYFMSELERGLLSSCFKVMYAFSKRESVDQPQPDGSVKKIQVFRHAGFVEV